MSWNQIPVPQHKSFRRTKRVMLGFVTLKLLKRYETHNILKKLRQLRRLLEKAMTVQNNLIGFTKERIGL